VTEATRERTAQLGAVFAGMVAFFAFCGWWVLIPTNIAWLDYGDRAMHQLGWMFFREAPWGMPPGTSPRLGIEIANSIALVDGLPLLAIPFKLVEQWLPHPFQYWGYWLLLSFVLQSLFAWHVAREFGADRRVALVAASFVLIAPAYLFRVPLHLALSGHWTMLAALYLYVRREPPRLWMWPLLVGVTSAIHATLLAMVLALWGAAWLQRVWARRAPFGLLAAEAGLGVGAGLAVLWAVGFFGTSSYGSYGYGDYKLNLLWPILSYGWSQVFPDLPHTRFDYEGLSFLGIGVLALLLLVIVTGGLAPVRRAVSRTWLPLTVMVVALMVFAFSKDVSILNIDIVSLTMPAFVEALGAAFRSTGRFVWPALYLVTIGVVVLIGRRFRLWVALPVLLLALVAQAADSFPKWREFAARMPSPSGTWASDLESPLWQRAAAAGYNRVRSIPVKEGFGSDWKALGYYAVIHGMDIDTVYLGRVDREALQELRVHQQGVLLSGDFEPRTIYVLDLPTSLVVARHAGPDDLLSIVDGRIVYLPGGRLLGEGLDSWNGGD
jgi:hypothetical protein